MAYRRIYPNTMEPNDRNSSNFARIVFGYGLMNIDASRSASVESGGATLGDRRALIEFAIRIARMAP
jgi:hypothetical protein